jgi:nucleotidyltransferase/DNA polymerase involved in DNA repair
MLDQHESHPDLDGRAFNNSVNASRPPARSANRHDRKRESWAPLQCSVGIAANRLLAKLASDMEKPDGLTILQPEDLPGAILRAC